MGLHDRTHANDGKSLDATTVPTELDIAYAAGFYDGEGTCYAKCGKYAQARVFQKDPEMLYKFRDFFGGNVRPVAGHAARGINGGPLFEWAVTGTRAKEFLRKIYPFVSSRRKQQIDATNFREDKPEPRKIALVQVEMTDERRIARSVMNAQEKHRESCKWHRERNRERTRHLGTNLARRKHTVKPEISSVEIVNV